MMNVKMKMMKMTKMMLMMMMMMMMMVAQHWDPFGIEMFLQSLDRVKGLEMLGFAQHRAQRGETKMKMKMKMKMMKMMMKMMMIAQHRDPFGIEMFLQSLDRAKALEMLGFAQHRAQRGETKIKMKMKMKMKMKVMMGHFENQMLSFAINL